MEFQLGSLSIKVYPSKVAIVVFPIGSHMVAIKTELFQRVMNQSDSVKMEAQIYSKDDTVVKDIVQRWIHEEESANN